MNFLFRFLHTVELPTSNECFRNLYPTPLYLFDDTKQDNNVLNALTIFLHLLHLGTAESLPFNHFWRGHNGFEICLDACTSRIKHMISFQM